MRETTFTFRLNETLKSDFASAAKAHDRNGAQLLRDFMRSFVQQQQQAAAHDAWFRDQAQIGLAAAQAGEVLSAEDVEAGAAAWRADVRGKTAAP